MQDKDLFEYAVIRVVPRVDREEFLNVGVILYCSRLKFLELAYQLDSSRLLSVCPALDIAELSDHLHAFAEITRGSREGGPIGELDGRSGQANVVGDVFAGQPRDRSGEGNC